MNRSRIAALATAFVLAAALPLAAATALVAIDAAHGNYHTASGRYAPFAELVRGEGHEIVEITTEFSAESLADVGILVIANALAEENLQRWELPTPSAFTAAEIEALHAWVTGGGRLLLIADHMPFPGAVAGLAARFGVVMENGFAFGPGSEGNLRFDTGDGTLAEHPIVNGLAGDEPIPPVVSFMGQAFTVEPDADARPLLVLSSGSVQLLPERAWDFTDETPRHDAGGMLQGVALIVGEGRVVVFGEAAMFTSQPSGPGEPPVGFDHPDAPGNRAFLINVICWLSGELPAR